MVPCGEAERQSQALAPSPLQLPGQRGAQERWIMKKNLSGDECLNIKRIWTQEWVQRRAQRCSEGWRQAGRDGSVQPGEEKAVGDLRASSDFGYPVPQVSPAVPSWASQHLPTSERPEGFCSRGIVSVPLGQVPPERARQTPQAAAYLCLTSLAGTRASEELAAHFGGESWVKLTKNSPWHL